MKLLVDNQLPEALATFFNEHGIEAFHVRQLGLGAAQDADIWRYAKDNGFGIVSMDEDFQDFATRYGTPPRVVWVRLGNVRRHALLETFSQLLLSLQAELDSGTPVIEIGQG